MSNQQQNSNVLEVLDNSIATLNEDVDKWFDAAFKSQASSPQKAMQYQRRANVLNLCVAGVINSKQRLMDIQAIVSYYAQHEFNMAVRPDVLTDAQWVLLEETVKGNPLAKLDDAFVLFKSLLTYPM